MGIAVNGMVLLGLTPFAHFVSLLANGIDIGGGTLVKFAWRPLDMGWSAGETRRDTSGDTTYETAACVVLRYVSDSR